MLEKPPLLLLLLLLPQAVGKEEVLAKKKKLLLFLLPLFLRGGFQILSQAKRSNTIDYNIMKAAKIARSLTNDS